MKPLELLPREPCQTLVGVVFDVDDTLTRDGTIEREAFESLWRLADAGIHRIAVTGRPLGWAEVMAMHWPIDAAVGENGAGWFWREGANLREGYFDSENQRENHREVFARIVARVGRDLPHVRQPLDQRARRCDLAFDVAERDHLSSVDVGALVALIESEGARALVSSVHVHAQMSSCDKARGAERAARDALGLHLESTRTSWIFVGDSGNDAAAFAWFPVSVGVANVVDHLERIELHPVFITRLDRGRGFAEVVDHILRARLTPR